MSSPREIPTWRTRRGLVSWNFDLPLHHNEPLDVAMRRRVLTIVALLDEFARPRNAVWTTSSRGEDIVELEGDAINVAGLERTFEAHPDTIQVLFTLNLLCDGFEIVDGATLFIERSDPKVVSDEELELYLVLSLHTDIYAARTFAENRDNRELARRYAPRLNGFLARLREELDARLYDLDDSSGYGDQVDETGFKAPESNL